MTKPFFVYKHKEIVYLEDLPEVLFENKLDLTDGDIIFLISLTTVPNGLKLTWDIVAKKMNLSYQMLNRRRNKLKEMGLIQERNWEGMNCLYVTVPGVPMEKVIDSWENLTIWS